MTVEVEMPDLAPFQQAWFDGRKPITAIEGATGTGKTYVFEPYLFKRAHDASKAGKEFWWVSPTVNQAKEVYLDIKRRLEEAGALEGGLYKTNDTNREIHVPGGGILVGKTAEEPNNLYGNRQVEEIVGDEFTRWRFSVLGALMSVANKNGAWITLIGNYQGDGSVWHSWIEKMLGDPDFAYFRTPATEAVEAGIMDRALFERARRTLPEDIFRALYLCEGAVDDAMLVKYGAVSDLWTNEHVEEGDPALTCDIAMHGSDRFVMHRWAGWVLKDIEVMRLMNADEIEQVIKARAIQHEIPRSRIVFDGDGMGAYLTSYLKGAVEYRGGSVQIHMEGRKMNYQNLRSQCHFLAADRINERGMYIETQAHRDELHQEVLACLRTSGQDAAGRWGIWPKDHPKQGAKMRLGRSPDLFDPIPMRVYLDILPHGRVADTIGEGLERQVKRFKMRGPQKPKNIFGGR